MKKRMKTHQINKRSGRSVNISRFGHAPGIFVIMLALCITMALTSCGSEEGRQRGSGSDQAEVSADPAGSSSAESEASKTDDDTAVMKVGDTTVTYRDIKAYLCMIDADYLSALGNDILGVDIGGKKLGDDIQEDVMNYVAEMQIIKDRAAKENITLSTVEKDNAAQSAQGLFNKLSSDIRDRYSITLADLEQVYEENQIAEKLYYSVVSKGNDSVSEDQARQAVIEYICILTDGVDKDGSRVSLTDAEKTSALERANELREEAKQASDFSSFARINTEKSEVNTVCSLIYSDSDLPDPVNKAAMQLDSGEISEVIPGDDGYYILYCVNDNDETLSAAKKEDIINRNKNLRFKDAYSEWLNKTDISVNDTFWENLWK
ncbi:MAG: peptidyl-prolyl cis-trans isomerase [Lachnospiraceae bacterium]|jgi:parvulin-like peptidyl-prolyl isomerase|nr:peptidyl-prolyl cis-trans isomerase [Lachnospiraceae bacterium]MEE3460773.1 peptidyl-prolyl cis-trans isomerase [Lachnospiraceae bacterium]